MTLNLSSDTHQPDAASDSTPQVTLVGLFEDAIDARNALAGLRKDGSPSASVSLLLRDRKADEGGPTQRHGAVAKAVDEADLNAHSGWLQGLASLIVPERGTFLVAGMLGSALAGVSLDAGEDDELPVSALEMILEDFGFVADEVDYIESRILAGAMLVAVTTNDQRQLASSRDVLAENNAVHIGAARTTDDVAQAASELLESPPEVYGDSDVVVTDAVAPLRALINGTQGVKWARSLKGRRVVDRDGEESGRIDNLIAEPPADDTSIGSEHLRYIVVSYGGVLGLGRRMAAVPVEHITLDDDLARVSVAREVLQQAPSYDPGAPFSRREEQVVCAYFGCTPYWSED